MKEYVRGAFWTPAWAMMILSNCQGHGSAREDLSEIGKALDKIKTKAARDFTADIQAELKLQDQ